MHSTTGVCSEQRGQPRLQEGWWGHRRHFCKQQPGHVCRPATHPNSEVASGDVKSSVSLLEAPRIFREPFLWVTGERDPKLSRPRTKSREGYFPFNNYRV